MMEESSRQQPTLGTAEAQLGGWLAVGLTNVAVVAAKLPRPPGGLGVRLLHHAFDLGQGLAAGLLSAVAVAAFLRWGPKARLAGFAAIFAAAALVGVLVLPSDFAGVAGPSGPLPLLVSAAASAVIPITAAFGRAVARRVRFVPAVAGVGLAVTNGFIFERSYLGLHLFASWIAALLVAASLDGLTLRRPRRIPPRVLVAVQAALSVAAAAAVAVKVPVAVLVEMYKAPSSSLAPFLARIHATEGSAHVEGAWYADRRGLPDVPPTKPERQGDVVVLLLTIDCFRWDLLQDDKYRATLPNLFALRDEGVFFPRARAASPSTVPSLAAVFTGRFYSQLYWSEQKGGGRQRLYPHNDETPRLPALLSRGGVQTSLVMSGTGFAAHYGTTAGFDEYIDKGSPVGIPATKITDHVLARMRRQKESGGSLFVFSHYFEPHAPYDRAGKEGEPFDRYLREVAIVDAELGRVRAAVDELGWRDRTLLIVTGDHGEAFGEHNTFDHAVSLYDELVRVPLVVWGGGYAPRTVDQLVSIADLGPTILDLNRLPAPASFLGQSLVPLLRGEDVVLERPVVAESGRHVQAMFFPDGYKLLVDRRLGTQELYDLGKDPGELRDLSATEPEVFAEKLARLRAYFEAHAYKREGYQLPYRP